MKGTTRRAKAVKRLMARKCRCGGQMLWGKFHDVIEDTQGWGYYCEDCDSLKKQGQWKDVSEIEIVIH